MHHLTPLAFVALLMLSGCSAPAASLTWSVDEDAGSAAAAPPRGPFAPGDTLVYRVLVKNDHDPVPVGIGYQSLRLVSVETVGGEAVEHWATHVEDGAWEDGAWKPTQRYVGSLRVRASDGARMEVATRMERPDPNGTWRMEWDSVRAFHSPCAVLGDTPGLPLGGLQDDPCTFQTRLEDASGRESLRNGTVEDTVSVSSADVVEVPAGRFEAVRLHVVRGDQPYNRWLSRCGEVLSIEDRGGFSWVTELLATSACGSGTAPALPDEVPFDPTHDGIGWT